MGLLSCRQIRQPQLIPKGWMENHYKQLVVESEGKVRLEGVVKGLVERYRHEIVGGGERSAVRLIYEGDSNPGNCIVLRINQIRYYIKKFKVGKKYFSFKSRRIVTIFDLETFA